MNQIAIQQIASELTLAGTDPKVRERIGNGRRMAFRRAETLLCPLLMSSPSQTLTPYKGVYVIEGDIISPQIPDTDPDGQAFRRWSEVAETASGAIGQPFYVSPLLERQATADQKERKIDLLDHLFEGGGLKPPNTSFEASKRPV